MTYTPQNAFTFPFSPIFPMLPAINFITAITQSNPAIVTTATDHGYSNGLSVRIVFPQTFNPSFGMTQIDDQTGEIVVISATTFSVDIDTTRYNAFAITSSAQMPQVIPIAVAAQTSDDDSGQLNPPAAQQNVVIFQQRSPQCRGPCTVP